MQTITSPEQYQQSIQQGASLVVFGGEHCGVCQSIKPKLADLIKERFPKFEIIHVDCGQSPEICAQEGVFTLPVIKLYIDGQMHIEQARHINMSGLTIQLERLHSLWNTSND